MSLASLTCVSENDIPDWLVKAAEETNAMVREVMPIVRAAQETMDVARAAQQFAEDAQAAQLYTDALRSAERFARDARATQRYLEDLRAAQAAAGPSLLPGHEVALAMDAGMRELFATVSQQLEHRTAYSGFKGYMNFTGTVALAPMGVAGAGEVGTATDTLAARDDSPTDVGMPLDAKTVLLAIMWVMALLLPVAILLMSPEVQTVIVNFLVAIGTALIIHWRVQDGRKR